MRPLAILFATAHIVGSAVAAYLLFFIATVPFENSEPGDGEWESAFISIGIALLALAIVTGVGLARRRKWALGSLALHLAVGLTFVWWALGVSDHSDEKLLLFATAVEAAGLFAALFSLE